MARTGLITMIYQATSGRYEPYGNIDEADCVVGQAFGKRHRNGLWAPGLGNAALAEFAAQHLAHLPMFLQDELAQAVQARLPLARVVETFGCIDHRDFTINLMVDMIAALHRCGYVRPVLLAAAGHEPRCEALWWHLHGPEPVVLPGLPDGWDAQSQQPWTRRRSLWCAKEPLMIVHHRFKGWI